MVRRRNGLEVADGPSDPDLNSLPPECHVESVNVDYTMYICNIAEEHRRLIHILHQMQDESNPRQIHLTNVPLNVRNRRKNTLKRIFVAPASFMNKFRVLISPYSGTGNAGM